MRHPRVVVAFAPVLATVVLTEMGARGTDDDALTYNGRISDDQRAVHLNVKDGHAEQARHEQLKGRPEYELARYQRAPMCNVSSQLSTPAGPVDIEVDGTHHQDVRGRQRRQDLARDAVLQGLGWRVVRVPAWRALAEADVVARELAVAMFRR